MLRSSALLLLAAVLAASSLWLTWGEKSVAYEECRLDLEAQHRVCDVQSVRASYDPRALRGEVASHEVAGGDVEHLGTQRFRHAYDEPARGDASWWRSPVLPWARPALLAGAVAAPVAVVLGWLGRRPSWSAWASWAPVGAAVAVGGGVVAALGGVALHAVAWTASRVEPLEPMPGTWVLLASGLSGVAGGLRMHVLLRDRAEGRTGSSPLVPADALYGFGREEPVAESGAEPGAEPEEESQGAVLRRLRWSTGSTVAVAALLLLLPLGLPLATKDVTVRACVEEEARGFVCSHESLSVAYHAAHATVASPGTARMDYLGAFQQAHGGPWWMGLGAVASAVGAVVLVAWLALDARGDLPRGSRLRAAGVLLLAGGFALAVLGVAVQASGWVGVPAGRSRPGLGLFAGLAGLAVLLLQRVRSGRLPRAGPETATPTSGAG